MRIESPTYLIAELAGETAAFVTGLRKIHNPDRVAWPVDITLAGSSGVGTIKVGQDVSEVAKILEPLVAENYFSNVNFEGIQKFPNSGIFSLRPIRPAIVRMHEAIANSGVEFNPVSFPFNPHCTLRAGEPLTNDEEFLGMTFPSSAKIECFSLYQPASYGGKRIHTFERNSAHDRDSTATSV